MLLLYVHDILVARSSMKEIANLNTGLAKEFSMRTWVLGVKFMK